MNVPVPNVAQLASMRTKAKEIVGNVTALLGANQLSAGHFCLFPEPASDALSIMFGLVVEELRALDWRIVSHSSAVVGADQRSQIPVLFVSVLIERATGKQLVHLG